MKFIRDIISEKRAQASVPAEAQKKVRQHSKLTEDQGLVHDDMKTEEEILRDVRADGLQDASQPYLLQDPDSPTPDDPGPDSQDTDAAPDASRTDEPADVLGEYEPAGTALDSFEFGGGQRLAPASAKAGALDPADDDFETGAGVADEPEPDPAPIAALADGDDTPVETADDLPDVPDAVEMAADLPAGESADPKEATEPKTAQSKPEVQSEPDAQAEPDAEADASADAAPESGEPRAPVSARSAVFDAYRAASAAQAGPGGSDPIEAPAAKAGPGAVGGSSDKTPEGATPSAAKKAESKAVAKRLAHSAPKVTRRPMTEILRSPDGHIPPMPKVDRSAAPVSAPPAPPEVAEPEPSHPQPETSGPVDVPAPAAGRGSRRAGRVKTRLLGFNGAQGPGGDPIANASAKTGAPADPAPSAGPVKYPVGWLVVVGGPGCGNALPLFNGVAQIGRGEGQAVRLDFGDTSISRENHAALAYDGESRAFYLGHGGKANLVRLNKRPVLSTEELSTGDIIRIGETELRFVALCGKDFDWSAIQQGSLQNVSFG